MIKQLKRIWGDSDVTYRVARSDEDIEITRDLRFQVFGPEEANPPYITSRDSVSDSYDLIASNVLAECLGDPAGTLRIIDQRKLKCLKDVDGVARDESGKVVFPIENHMPYIGDIIKERYEDGRNVIVIDKLTVPSRFSGKGIATGLYASCYKYALKTDVDDTFVLINCEAHSRGRDDIADEERVKIPDTYLGMGFSLIGEIFYYDDFNAHAAIMHNDVKKDPTMKIKLLTYVRALNGRIADFNGINAKKLDDKDSTITIRGIKPEHVYTTY